MTHRRHQWIKKGRYLCMRTPTTEESVLCGLVVPIQHTSHHLSPREVRCGGVALPGKYCRALFLPLEWGRVTAGVLRIAKFFGPRLRGCDALGWFPPPRAVGASRSRAATDPGGVGLPGGARRALGAPCSGRAKRAPPRGACGSPGISRAGVARPSAATQPTP